jgi:serine/threonine protein kinase
MNGLQGEHPTHEMLAALGLGGLDDVEAAAVERHLNDCTQCQRVLEATPEDTFLEKLRASATTAPTAAAGSHEAPTLSHATPVPSGMDEIPTELSRHPRYRILHVLGAGGMGTVYKAEHMLMGRPVALKVIRRELIGDPSTVERFRREVRSAARLNHPNIVTAHDAEQAGEVHFLAMESVEGTSLDRLVEQRGPLPPLLACDYARQAALGLQHAFERGMVHRDIKPQNLMRTADGRVKVLDFGLARFASESAAWPRGTGAGAAGTVPRQPDVTSASLTASGSVMGTPDYMAPEQAVNPHAADIRADIYSLGCTLYYLLTGQVPFPAPAVFDKLMAHAERAAKPLTEVRPAVSPELDRIVVRMMAKDPARRYQTPLEVAQALEAAIRTAGSGPLSEAEPKPPSHPTPRRRLWTGVVTGCAGVGLLLTFVALYARGREETMIETMGNVYLVCALLGCTLLGCQFLLSLLGLDHHDEVGSSAFHDVGHDLHGGHDADHDAQATWFAGVLTFRTLVAALTFFGLAGRAGAAAGVEPGPTFALALAAGAGALFLVAWLMRALYRLKADGTVRIQRAMGQTGTVYLPVPAGRSGMGKVQLNVQNRTMEYQAITPHTALPAGAKITVVAVVNSDTVEVVPVTAPEMVTHV